MRYKKDRLTNCQKLMASKKLLADFKRDYKTMGVQYLMKKYGIQPHECNNVIVHLALKPRNVSISSNIWRSINPVKPNYCTMNFGILFKACERAGL